VNKNENPAYHRIRTWPNALTSIRLLMACLAAVLFYMHGPTLTPIVICMVAATLDLVDGWVARRFSQVTRLGEHLDPLADKILTSIIFLALAFFIKNNWILMMVFLLLLREWGITWVREYYSKRLDCTLPASRLGKWKMVAQSLFGNLFLFLLYLQDVQGVPRDDNFLTTFFAALGMILVLSYASAIRYLIRLHAHATAPDNQS
jgi:CDP-diacylglycerol--glycerol-3-phosphate 3-phosphatidyltransferase